MDDNSRRSKFAALFRQLLAQLFSLNHKIHSILYLMDTIEIVNQMDLMFFQEVIKFVLMRHEVLMLLLS
jgi:hypothetical protein